MIKLDKASKLAESASLVIKSPIIAFQSKAPDYKNKQNKKVVHLHNYSIAKEGNSNIANNYTTTPKKQLNGQRGRGDTSDNEQDRRLNSVNARRNYYEVKTTNTIISSVKPAADCVNEDSS